MYLARVLSNKKLMGVRVYERYEPCIVTVNACPCF